MFGWLSSLVFGLTCFFSWADDDKYEKQRRDNSKKDGSPYYIDKNGRLRHTYSNRKFTPEDVHNTFFSHEHDIAIEKMCYEKFLKQCPGVDPEWYTLKDFIINHYRKDLVTGKQKFPEIDWDNLPDPKPFRKPKEYFWCVYDMSDPRYCPHYVFETEAEAREYAKKKFQNPLLRSIKTVEKEKVYKGVNMFDCSAIYIMKDGTVYTKKEENK